MIDVFGNQIFADDAAINAGNLTSGGFAVKQLNPLNYSTTILFNTQISQSAFFMTNLSAMTFRLAQNPIESYYDFICEIGSMQKYLCISTLFEGGQFWGKCVGVKPLEGRRYANDDEFYTISEKEVYFGKYCSISRNFKYFGFLENNMPQYYGEFHVNNNKVYQGEISQGNSVQSYHRCSRR